MVRAMKWLIATLFLFTVLALGCAHGPQALPSPAPSAVPPSSGPDTATSGPERLFPQSPETAAKAGGESSADIKPEVKEEKAAPTPPPEPAGSAEIAIKSSAGSSADPGFLDYVEEKDEEPKEGIADPLEPFNRAMYHFNDKLYFWVLKPVARGYRTVVPEEARVGVRNFFTNITFPVRFVNCLLQANFRGAASELGRFAINTLLGIGGLFDVASIPEINLLKQDEDFGQTLGVFGLGQGFYINWPILGPSSPRDTLGLAGDGFLHPLYYLAPWDVSLGVRAYEEVNDTSLSIGDYESLKEAAIDPYVAIRDAYVQYRQKKVKDQGTNRLLPSALGPGIHP